MCFSEAASFTAGGVLVATGVGTVALATREEVRRDLAIAAVPLLFGLQQLSEGFVWHALRGHMAMPAIHTSGWATVVFLSFALVLWPIYVPIAVAITERRRGRRSAVLALGACGWVSGTALAVAMTHGVSGRVRGHSIVYSVTVGHGTLVLIGYLIGTCATCLASSQRSVVALGVAVSVLAAVAWASYAAAFVSVWCFFAALVSIVVIAHLVRVRRGPGLHVELAPTSA